MPSRTIVGGMDAPFVLRRDDEVSRLRAENAALVEMLRCIVTEVDAEEDWNRKGYRMDGHTVAEAKRLLARLGKIPAIPANAPQAAKERFPVIPGAPQFTD